MSKAIAWESCCKGRRSCPQVAIEGDKLWIRDDEDSQVCLTLDQFVDVNQKVNEILSHLIDAASEDK